MKHWKMVTVSTYTCKKMYNLWIWDVIDHNRIHNDIIEVYAEYINYLGEGIAWIESDNFNKYFLILLEREGGQGWEVGGGRE